MDVVFAALLISVFVGFALTYRFQKAIQVLEPETFDLLGRPNIFTNNTIANGFKFQRWVFSLRFRRSHEPSIRLQGWVLFAFQLWYLGGLATLAAIIVSTPAA